MHIRQLLTSLSVLLFAVTVQAGTYTVKAGDTISGIAKSNNTKQVVILSVNPQITDPNMIRIGQKINLPGGSEVAGRTAADFSFNRSGAYPKHKLNESSIGRAPLGRISDPAKALAGFSMPEEWKSKALVAIGNKYNRQTGAWDESAKIYHLRSGDVFEEVNYRNYKVMRNGVGYYFKDPNHSYLTWTTDVQVEDFDGQAAVLQIIYFSRCGNWGWRIFRPGPPAVNIPPETTTIVPPLFGEPPKAPPKEESCGAFCFEGQSQIGGGIYQDLLNKGRGWHAYGDITLWLWCPEASGSKFKFGPTAHYAFGGGDSEGYKYDWREHYFGLAAEYETEEGFLASAKAGLGKRRNDGHIDLYESHQRTKMFYFSSWFTDDKWYKDDPDGLFSGQEGGFFFNSPIGSPEHRHSWDGNALGYDPADTAVYEARYRLLLTRKNISEDFAYRPFLQFGATYEDYDNSVHAAALIGVKLEYKEDSIFLIDAGIRKRIDGPGALALAEVWAKPEGIWAVYRDSQIKPGDPANIQPKQVVTDNSNVSVASAKIERPTQKVSQSADNSPLITQNELRYGQGLNGFFAPSGDWRPE